MTEIDNELDKEIIVPSRKMVQRKKQFALENEIIDSYLYSSLFNEKPIPINKNYALAFGLNAAIVIQKIHEFISDHSKAEKHQGIFWISKSYQEWEEELPFLSYKKIRGAIRLLENEEIIISAQLKKFSGDKTKFYTLNYKKLERLSQ